MAKVEAVAQQLAAVDPNFGNYNLNEGQLVYFLGNSGTFANAGQWPGLDGFLFVGATAQAVTAGQTLANPTVPEVTSTQGGAIHLHNHINFARITNNIVAGASGVYAGGIRVGSPQLMRSPNDISVFNPRYQNKVVFIGHNRLVACGGSATGGAIGLFAGSDHFKVTQNQICASYSGERSSTASPAGHTG